MPEPDDQFAPRCRCTAEQIADGHRHRCPSGPVTFVALGVWAGMDNDQIERKVLAPTGLGVLHTHPYATVRESD